MAERGKKQRTANQRAVARTRKTRERSLRLIRGFLFVLIMAAAFVCGFVVRGHPSFLQSLGFPESITGLSPAVTDTSGNADVFNSLSARVAEIEDVLAKDSMNKYDLDDATAKTVEAFAEASDDKYVSYYSPERYSELLNSQEENTYAGVGVLFSEYNGEAYVVDVFEESEAQQEGVKEGDFVASVDGDSSHAWSRSEVAALLSQKEGATVVIEWRRPESLEADGGKRFKTTLECKEYAQVNVTSEYDEERTVGYINVSQLTQNASTLVQNAITDLANRGARSFVLDLRDNPGGYLSQAVGLASLFMSSGSVVEIQTVDGQSAKPATGQPATQAPLVVIVNKNTAAAAEVVAAALKDSQRATLVGVTTMGKGSVQVNHELSFGGAIRYTAAYYLTPQGHAIDKVGVTPDVILDASGEGDPQRSYAIEDAAGRIVE